MKTRVISAVIAVAILITIFAVWRDVGLRVIGILAGLGCIYEYSRLTFAKLDVPNHLRIVFLILAAIVFASTLRFETFAISAIALAAVFYLVMALMTVSRSTDLPIVLQLSASAILGFVYCGVLPALAVRIIGLPNGTTWFFGMLAIVFSGDTFAYLVGRKFGKTKLLEPVSPQKTVEGSFGGLIGSSVAGLCLGLFFFKELPLQWLVLTALATGAFAQVGDLFESLLKRVAEVKDSGTIMPGHGGILDRLDGVLFAAPIYYVFATFLA